MRTNRLLGIAAGLALTIALASAAVVWAQTTATTGPDRRARFGLDRLMALNRIGRQLNLTDEQKQQVKDIVRGHKADIKTLADRGFATRKALRQAIAAGDSNQIASAVNQLSEVELKSAQTAAQIRAVVFSRVLQPDQRTKAGQLAAQFEERADQRHHRLDQMIDQF